MGQYSFWESAEGEKSQLLPVKQLEQIIYQISEAANLALCLEEFYPEIHRIIAQLISAKNLYIALYDTNMDAIKICYYADEFSAKPDKEIREKSLLEYIIKTGAPLLMSSSTHDEMVQQGKITKIEKKNIDWLGVPLKNAQQQVIGVLTVQSYLLGRNYTQKDQDILSFVSTQVAMVIERKRVEEALRDREEQYRAIVENSHDAIYIFSENKIIYANDNLCKLLLISRRDIAKTNVLDYIHPEDQLLIRQYITKQKNEDPQLSVCEARIFDKKGQLKFIELNLTKSICHGKETFIWAIRDITERKMAEKLQKALYLISETANSSLDIEGLYQAVHQIIGELIVAKNLYIALYDEQTDMINFPYFSDEKDVNPGPLKCGNGLTDYVLRTGEPLFISKEAHTQLIQQEGITRRGTFSVDWLGVPLKTADDKVFGVLAVQTHQPGIRYTHKDKDILTFVSNQVAMVIKRKQDETHLQYFSFRDSLSGLYNRRYFEEEMRRMDQRRQGSVALIVIDVDGLKLINDMFGHDSGDKLLASVAALLTNCFREQDIVARIGGDEYAILFQNIDQQGLESACERLEQGIMGKNLDTNSPPLSLSIGFAISEDTSHTMGELFKVADSKMYEKKLARGQRAQNAIVQRMMKLWEKRDFILDGHGDRMQKMAIELGEKCGLNSYELSDLCLLAQFHDVGKIGIMENILLKPGLLTAGEKKIMQSHSEMGHRIARSSPDLIPIAELILKHHEWWNGQGYPLGLVGNEIPLECRIIAIVDAYDAMTSQRPYREKVNHQAAINELRRYAGIQFDPELVEKFIQ